MTDIPFIAISGDELGDLIQKGDYVTNGHTEGLVQYAKYKHGKETNLLCFISAEPHDYLVGINGKLLQGVKILNKKRQEN